MRQSQMRAKELILDAAKRMMEVRGYSRTPLGDILRESGTGKGSFYHHFESKQDLGYAIIEQVGREFAMRTLDPIFADRRRSPLDQVDALLEAILASTRDRNGVGGCPLGNLATELADFHEGFRCKLAQMFELWRARLAEALAQARADGTLVAEIDPDAAARFLVAALEGAMLLTKVERDIRVMETCVAELRWHLARYHAGPVPGEPGVTRRPTA